MDNHKKKSSVAILSVFSNATLVVFKLIIGLMIGSVSVISEAIHSGVDLLAALIAFFAIRTAGNPADKDHPFGHGKAENISGTVEALLIFFAATGIIYEAIHKLLKPQPIESAGWGVGVMLVSALANFVVSRQLFRVGVETDSIALQADAWHLRTDVYTSAGVMCGLTLMQIGHRLFPAIDFGWMDPTAAIAVALLIIHAAYKLTVDSARDLMDVTLPNEEVQWIQDYLVGRSPVVRGFHHLRTRKAGPQRFIEFHMVVDSEMTVRDSHRLSDEVLYAIKEHLPDSTVTTHIEPCDGSCTEACSSLCLLKQNERETIHQEHLTSGPMGK